MTWRAWYLRWGQRKEAIFALIPSRPFCLPLGTAEALLRDGKSRADMFQATLRQGSRQHLSKQKIANRATIGSIDQQRSGVSHLWIWQRFWSIFIVSKNPWNSIIDLLICPKILRKVSFISTIPFAILPVLLHRWTPPLFSIFLQLETFILV